VVAPLDTVVAVTFVVVAVEVDAAPAFDPKLAPSPLRIATVAAAIAIRPRFAVFVDVRLFPFEALSIFTLISPFVRPG
jgi:hypothetical protein